MKIRAIAATELVLISPAALFMAALALRSMQPQYELARSAQELVMWYAGRIWTLWVLLLALPFAVLVIGCATLLRGWNRDVGLPNAARQSLAVIRERRATLFVAAATLTAAAILMIVVLHTLAN